MVLVINCLLVRKQGSEPWPYKLILLCSLIYSLWGTLTHTSSWSKWRKRWDTEILGSSLKRELSSLIVCSVWSPLEDKSIFHAELLKVCRAWDQASPWIPQLPMLWAEAQITISVSFWNGGVWGKRELCVRTEIIQSSWSNWELNSLLGPARSQEQVLRTEDGAPPVPFVELPQPAHLAAMWRQSLRNVACWEE